MKKTGGYVPQPLIGIWARAPYLHNGSVPTIAELLKDPRDRMSGYRLDADPNQMSDYDQQSIGWKVTPLNSKAGAATRDEYTRIYDPGLSEGLSNQGHNVSTDLTEQEKRDLMEFLKKI